MGDDMKLPHPVNALQMRRVFQPRVTQTDDDCGHCLRAAIASIIGVDFHHTPVLNRADFYERIADYLEEQGLGVALSRSDLPHPKAMPLHVATLAANDGGFHAVVHDGDRIVHDPLRVRPEQDREITQRWWVTTEPVERLTNYDVYWGAHTPRKRWWQR